MKCTIDASRAEMLARQQSHKASYLIETAEELLGSMAGSGSDCGFQDLTPRVAASGSDCAF